MTETDTVKVGMTKKTYGTKGELKLAVKDVFVEDLLKVDVAFLKIQGKLVPYFIEYFDYTNNLLVKFEEVDSPEAASKLTSKEFFLRKEAIKVDLTDEADTPELEKLVGFQINDDTVGPVGKIEELIEMPQQLMAIVIYQDREVMIPLHVDLVSEIDQDQRIIKMKLPEGILSIND
jgi:16S rRNA processing protein RimM